MSPVPDHRITSEEEYRNIFEAASDGLVIYDVGLDSVVEANHAACEMHGYTRHEFIGLNPASFMLPENLSLFREQAQTAEPGNVFEASVVHQRKNGSPFHVDVRRSLILYRDRPSSI